MISDALWARIELLVPLREKKVHPLGCHRPRIADRVVLNGIFFLLRTGRQWKSLDATGICKGSTAHSRFLEWIEAGLFARIEAGLFARIEAGLFARIEAGLLDCDEMIGLSFEWMSLDGALTKAPLGGKKRSQPLRPRKERRQTQHLDRI